MGVSYGSWVEVDGLDEARGECLGKVGCDHDDFHWMVVVVTGSRMRPEDLFCLYLELVADALHISLEDASKRIYLVSRCTCKGFCIRLDGCWMKNQLLESEFVWFIEQDCGYSIRSGESCRSFSESEGIKGAVKIIKDPDSDSKYHPFQQPAQTQIPAMVLQQTVPQMYPRVHASHLPYGQTSAYMQPLGRDPSYLLMSGDSTQLPGGGFKYGSPQYQTRYALKSGVTGRATHLYHPYKQPAQIQIPAMVLQQTVPHHMYTQVHASYQTSAYMPSLDSSQVALESSMEWERKLSQKSTLVGHVPTRTDARI